MAEIILASFCLTVLYLWVFYWIPFVYKAWLSTRNNTPSGEDR